MNDRLRSGPYTIPFIDVPSLLVRVSSMLAGVILYDSRGLGDLKNDQVSRHREYVDNFVRMLHKKQISFTNTAVGTSIPKVIVNGS